MTLLPELGAVIPQRVTAAPLARSAPVLQQLEACSKARLLQLCWPPEKGRGQTGQVLELQIQGGPRDHAGHFLLQIGSQRLGVTCQGHREAVAFVGTDGKVGAKGLNSLLGSASSCLKP
jgi:hypothetical protein